MDLKMPPVTFDWTVNLTHIISTIMFIATAVAGYYDLKSDVRDINTRLSGAVQEQRAQVAAQKIIDAAQDARVAVSTQELRDEVRNQTNDIKSDIRDLRNDLFYQGKLTPPPRK